MKSPFALGRRNSEIFIWEKGLYGKVPDWKQKTLFSSIKIFMVGNILVNFEFIGKLLSKNI